MYSESNRRFQSLTFDVEVYMKVLLVDEELADHVWEAWDKGEIDDQVALLAWWFIAYTQMEHARAFCKE